MKSDSILKGSPSDSDTSTIATPPTVVRRYVKPIYEEIRSSRRISFSAPSSPNSPDISQQLDGINFNTTSPMVSNENLTLSPNASLRGLKNRLLKRSRVITKSSNRVILHDSGDSNLNVNNLQDEISSSYHNETIYLGRCEIVSNLFESENASHQSPNAPLYMELIHPASTSTPKKFVTINDSSSPIISSSIIICDNSTSYEDQAAYDKVLNELRLFVPKSYCYLNPLLNGNMESVQAWLDSVNKACQSEVMSTLQNKSVSAEAKRNSALNSTTTVQIIKWLQKNVFPLQVEFEKIERLFDSQSERNFSEISPLILNLSALILDFIIKLESHKNFYSKDSIILSKFLGHIRSIREVTIDLKILTMKIDAEYMEDLLSMKNYMLSLILL